MKTVSAPAGFTEAELLDDLNDEQRRAVTHDRGPLLIVAGAGTGKTTVITKRIAWLIATGRAKPEEILALTFTDKAAGEMTERVDRLLPLGYTDLWISTFHAFCQRLLQAHGLDIGLPDDFRLLNQTDAYLLLRKNFDRFNLEYYRPLGNPTKFLTALLTLFSRAKDEAVHPRDYLEFAKNLALDKDIAVDGGEKSRQSELADAYHAYERLLLDHDCIDLGDLMLYALELFAKRPAILEKYRRQFKYVLVDEFQDTNWAQYELVKRLVPAGGNVVVVGDDDQSIYKFRGASVSNILQFKNDFTGAGEIVLTKNYRSLQNILDLTYGFIQRNNPNRLEAKLNAGRPEGSQLLTKKLAAERPGAAAISHLHFATLEDEVAGVVDKIVAIKDEKGEADWSDFAILVRSNANADDFSRELHRRSIPYQFLGLKGLYAKPIVMDCIAYFKLLDDYHESQALYRVLCSPAYRIAVEDLVRLTHESAKKAASLYEIAKNHRTIADLQEATRTTLDRLLGHIAAHAALARERSVAELLVKFLYDSGTIEHIKGDTVEDRDRASHLKQFLSRLKRFELGHDDPTLTHFMEELELERESGD
ncbi:UvrD-helicase domain-containing protein, partial [Candidatus Uhrbacteria bacterium]|nr:UvrD-helicase domain-containing protein [Candidatus Uhrbacteria bacterium]